MIYEYVCDECGNTFVMDRPPFDPGYPPECDGRRLGKEHELGLMRRLYGAIIDTSGCKDHDFIPQDKRVFDSVQSLSGERKGKLFTAHIDKKRKALRDGNHGEFRQTHSVPADLYHGKIKETGDKEYWSDPANMRRHESCRVDK